MIKKQKEFQNGSEIAGQRSDVVKILIEVLILFILLENYRTK